MPGATEGTSRSRRARSRCWAVAADFGAWVTLSGVVAGQWYDAVPGDPGRVGAGFADRGVLGPDLDQIAGPAAEEVAHRGQDVQGQVLRWLAHQPPELFSGQRDPPLGHTRFGSAVVRRWNTGRSCHTRNCLGGCHASRSCTTHWASPAAVPSRCWASSRLDSEMSSTVMSVCPRCRSASTTTDAPPPISTRPAATGRPRRDDLDEPVVTNAPSSSCDKRCG